MTIDYSLYQLKLKNCNGIREGALLRFKTHAGFGYSDCHPWTEYGDLSIREQLKALKLNQWNPLLVACKRLAGIDADARYERRSLFSSIPVAKSHVLTTLNTFKKEIEDWHQWGISLIKLKIRPSDLKQMIEMKSQLMQLPVRWRLDANASLSFYEIQQFLENMGEMLPSIELIEDPCPYNEEQWDQLESRFGIPLACDFEGPAIQDKFIIVHKPCSRELLYSNSKPLLVTSSLGHPVGQVLAAYIASTYKQTRNSVAGYLSHLTYEPSIFTDQMVIRKGALVPIEGYGLGFDVQLKMLNWKPL